MVFRDLLILVVKETKLHKITHVIMSFVKVYLLLYAIFLSKIGIFKKILQTIYVCDHLCNRCIVKIYIFGFFFFFFFFVIFIFHI